MLAGGGIDTVFASEWDEWAQRTYGANFKDSFPIAGDITKVDESSIPSFDICLAGFPARLFLLLESDGVSLTTTTDSLEEPSSPKWSVSANITNQS